MKTISKIKCPRCNDELEPCQGDPTIYQCASCEGALVQQSSLQPVLRQLAEGFDKDDNLEDLIVAIPDKGAGVNCPKCNSQMENYGYLQTDKVQIDGCQNCSVVWTDPDELLCMAAIHRRSMAAEDEILARNTLAKKQDSFLFAMRRLRRRHMY